MPFALGGGTTAEVLSFQARRAEGTGISDPLVTQTLKLHSTIRNLSAKLSLKNSHLSTPRKGNKSKIEFCNYPRPRSKILAATGSMREYARSPE